MSQTAIDRAAKATPQQVARRIRGLSDRAIAWIFVAPTILLLLAVNIFPLIWTINLSFTNFRANRNREVEYVGLRNYERILTDSDIWLTMQATAHFLFWTIFFQVLIGFALAWLINRKFKGNDLWTTIIVLPMMLSPAVVGNFWTFLYQPQIGLFNYIVAFFTGADPSSFEMIGSVTLAPWAIVIVDTWMWTPFVMLICLAGLRSIPDYIYEAAEIDRASKWRQFWTITVPMVLPFLMLAVLFRGIENFKMFDLVVQLTGGGPGVDHRTDLDQPQARGVREMAHGLCQRLRHHPVRDGLRAGLDLRQGAEQGEGAMSSYSITEPSARQKWIAGTLVILYGVITMIPLLWIIATGFKSPADAISYPPKVVFEPTLEGYVNLFTTRTRQTDEFLAANPPQNWMDDIVRQYDMVIVGPSRYGERFLNSIIIGFGSTFLSIFLGTLAAYAFSRFRVPLKDDLLFFILSTRMMPPIAVAIPIFLMFRTLGLSDTHLGMILLYTAVNISLAVWLLKGFIDEIPREYEEAALIDGYTRFQAFYKVVLPQAATGIASTAIFCLIFAWNEYAFAVLLTSGTAQTAPPFIPTIIGVGGQDWPAVAAGATLFLIPVMVFTVLLRKHLLRGITFGAVRK